MWHATRTKINQGNSRLLVVGSQIDSLTPDLFFGITYVLSTQMGNASTFQTSMFQKLSNSMMNLSIQWVLTPTTPFENSKVHRDFNFQSANSFGKCGGSFPHTLLHSREHEMWFSDFTLGQHLCKPLHWSRTQG
jgi:hypothetical protein